MDAALEASQNELSVIREKAVDSLGEEAAQVFDAHLMVLADPGNGWANQRNNPCEKDQCRSWSEKK